MTEEYRYEGTPEPDACPRCKARGKTWNGGDPHCSFRSGVFSEEGWNCATANDIRTIISQDDHRRRPHAVDYQYCDDQNYACINTGYIREFTEDQVPDVELGDCLWVGWYKHRGRTEAMWILGNGVPRPPTLAEVETVIKYFRERQPDLFVEREEF